MKITFVDSSGVEHVVAAQPGETAMRCATSHSIPGIAGECGGAMACGTCHVYVEGGWLSKLPAPSSQERDMLSGCLETQPNSRLSCQINLDEHLDGLTVRVPASQT